MRDERRYRAHRRCISGDERFIYLHAQLRCALEKMPDYCLRSTTNTLIYQLLFRIAAAGGVLEVSASDIYISTLVTGWQSTARRPFSRFLFFIAFTSQLTTSTRSLLPRTERFLRIIKPSKTRSLFSGELTTVLRSILLSGSCKQ